MTKFLFVAGLHRSGTSLIHKAIAQHPEVSGFFGTGVPEDEGQHLQSVYPPDDTYGGPGKFGFHPGSAFDEGSLLINPANREKLIQEWSKHWDMSKPVLIEKSPPNLTKTRFLQALFPESYFLIILRHPVAVSLATHKWSRSLLFDLFRHWVVAHRRFESDQPHLKKCLVIKYEDFVADQSTLLNQIFEFIQLEPYQQSIYQASEVHNQKYYQRWHELKAKPLYGIYLNFLSGLFEKDLKHFGYSFHDIEDRLASSAGH
ncbi:MAG: sulfotransferase [Candidatus Caenarcaniphilales bacterium]|nr:sulfotransferase [Candidatus Caenarcaniphilales bacterium]